ncbi:NADH:flavin oxidoreductase [Salpingoeca rosetta]|uniref:NADH:flavin oxidoreductase n=1 Tax=Salpingoeca rosetta (strain ATCC 50818 / BSB-021) TaxID=946362 RepID=F2U0T5_SALR5|nr:NADH:flavin oxidoreductase [Salpingoeca rosetta]EGD80509.1 NADH:flavin oxidoreductase [Salpingoeca rosetta]|eukprot:XP_004997070.1 NADH:flavin oxidoreductase [Salpingoeca rosetta]
MSKYPNLLKPLTLGGVELKNRVFMAPMTRGRGPGQIANEEVAKYYAQRASAGLIITEGVHPSKQGVGWLNVPAIFTDEQEEAWKPVVEAVHAKGGRIFMQLWHQGRQAHSDFHDLQPVSASDVEIENSDGLYTSKGKVPYEKPRPLTLDEIKETIEDYRKAAERAAAAGFDGVEIHAANGYLPDQFLQSKTNKRTDQYGGSIENRYRFLDEITEAVLTVLPKEKVGVRLSPNGTFGDMGSPEYRELYLYVATELGKKKLAYVHVMDGLGFGFHELGEPMTLKEFREVLPKETVLIGNVGYTAETAEKAIANGDADAIAFGRPFIPNPDLVERFANDWPLAEPAAPPTWFALDPEKPLSANYTDYPAYQQ